MEALDTLFSTIEANRSLMIELQTLLTSIPAIAPESGGQGEAEKCAALEKWLLSNGFTCSQLERFDAPDTRVKSGYRPNLVITLPGKTDTTLWIMAHLDVVPPGDTSLWHSNPYTVLEKDGKLYGRGVEDNQQGLCSAVSTVLAFMQNKIVPHYTIKLLFCADEEVGSAYGIEYLLNNHTLFSTNDLILIPDGGEPDGLAIEIAEKNLLWLRFCTQGKQAHASMPEQGVNAHLANAELALLLHKLEEDLEIRDTLFEPNRSTFQPTKKEIQEISINTIPGEDVFYMDCRILPNYSLNQIRSHIKERVAQVERKYGVHVECTEIQAVESSATPQDAQIVQALSKAIETVEGKKPRCIGIGGGTVASYLRNTGHKACVWSKMDETAHQPNEYCIIDNLISDAKVFAAVAVQN